MDFSDEAAYAEIGQCRAVLDRRRHSRIPKNEERILWQRIRQRVILMLVRHAEYSLGCERQLPQRLDCMEMDEDERIIVELYMPFVFGIAFKAWWPAVSFLDLFQEGIIGLMRAMRRYDYRRGVKFSTYATDWVHAEIIRFLDNHARTVRIPVHQMEYLRRCWRQGDGRPFQEMIQAVPLEDIREDREDWDEWLSDPSANLPEDIIFGSECAAYIRKRVALLANPHDREVVELLYGLREDGVAHTFRDIGPRLGITHMGVMERKKRALRRLQDEKLKELLEFF